MQNVNLTYVNKSLLLTNNCAVLHKRYDFLNPTYLAYGYTYDTNFVYHLCGSHDGLTWVELNKPIGSWNGFTCVQGLYVGFRNYAIALSTNGQDWNIIDTRPIFGNQSTIRSVVARPAKGDFLVVYKTASSSSVYPQGVITSDFQTFTSPINTPNGNSTTYIYSAGDYYFASYEWNSKGQFCYFDESTSTWVNFTDNIPKVFSGSHYYYNTWSYSGLAITFDGTYYRIIGKGAPDTSSPSWYRPYAIQSVSTNPTNRWSSASVGSQTGAESNWGGGAYMFQYVTQDTRWYSTTKRNLFSLNGSSYNLLSTSGTSSPLYYYFSPVGEHTFCWEFDYKNIRRIFNGIYYEVAFPEPITVTASNLTCINVPPSQSHYSGGQHSGS